MDRICRKEYSYNDSEKWLFIDIGFNWMLDTQELLTFIINHFLPYNTALPRLTAADGLFLFGIKKKQKMPAENFSLKASGLARSVKSEKFVRPELSRTEILYYGLAGRNCILSIKCCIIVPLNPSSRAK
ncbi:hypothetical protein DRW42_11515 [Pedobacter miscanthi]|uniref:Uncharacterized protein n=1 Tax=Pedobacter miscanthi TaxID=2259170 RepID=A0A366KZ16_9SPHI|nr:hypothetical protein DRW42_11515 [Pedobacter miscanthi]